MPGQLLILKACFLLGVGRIVLELCPEVLILHLYFFLREVLKGMYCLPVSSCRAPGRPGGIAKPQAVAEWEQKCVLGQRGCVNDSNVNFFVILFNAVIVYLFFFPLKIYCFLEPLNLQYLFLPFSTARSLLVKLDFVLFIKG